MHHILESDYDRLPLEMKCDLQGMHVIQLRNEQLVEGVHFQFVPENLSHSKLQMCRGCGQIKFIYSRDFCHTCYERERRHEKDGRWDRKRRDRYLLSVMKASMSRQTDVSKEKYPNNILLALKRYGDGIPDEADTAYVTRLKKTMHLVLTPEQTEVFDLRFKRRLNAITTSEILNCSRQNVHQHINNGLRALYQAMTDTQSGAFREVRLRKELLELPVTQLAVSRKLTNKLLAMGITHVAQVQELVNTHDGASGYGIRQSTLNKYRMALRILSETTSKGVQGQNPSSRKQRNRSSDSTYAESV